MHTKEILSIIAIAALGLCLICGLAKMAMKSDKAKKGCDDACSLLVFVAIVVLAVSQLLGEVNHFKSEDKCPGLGYPIYTDGYFSCQRGNCQEKEGGKWVDLNQGMYCGYGKNPAVLRCCESGNTGGNDTTSSLYPVPCRQYVNLAAGARRRPEVGVISDECTTCGDQNWLAAGGAGGRFQRNDMGPYIPSGRCEASNCPL